MTIIVTKIVIAEKGIYKAMATTTYSHEVREIALKAKFQAINAHARQLLFQVQQVTAGKQLVQLNQFPK